MDPNTGKIYRGEMEIAEARAAGVPLVNVGNRVADLMELGQQMDEALAPFTPEERENQTRQVRRRLQREAAKLARKAKC
jgi:uncharacterized protein (DUF2147 family)